MYGAHTLVMAGNKKLIFSTHGKKQRIQITYMLYYRSVARQQRRRNMIADATAVINSGDDDERDDERDGMCGDERDDERDDEHDNIEDIKVGKSYTRPLLNCNAKYGRWGWSMELQINGVNNLDWLLTREYSSIWAVNRL